MTKMLSCRCAICKFNLQKNLELTYSYTPGSNSVIDLIVQKRSTAAARRHSEARYRRAKAKGAAGSGDILSVSATRTPGRRCASAILLCRQRNTGGTTQQVLRKLLIERAWSAGTAGAQAQLTQGVDRGLVRPI